MPPRVCCDECSDPATRICACGRPVCDEHAVVSVAALIDGLNGGPAGNWQCRECRFGKEVPKS